MSDEIERVVADIAADEVAEAIADAARTGNTGSEAV